MIRLLVLTALIEFTVNLPVPDAKIFFPDENIPLSPHSAYSQHPSQVGQRSYFTKTSSYRKGGGYQSPIQWPPVGDGSEHQYGTSGHHASFSSYGHHPHHLSYPQHSYGTGSHQTHISGQSPVIHSYQTHSHSYGGSHPSDGSVGQIEQVSHGGTYHRKESQSSPQHVVHSWQETGNHGSQHGQHGTIVQEDSHLQQTSYGGQPTEGEIEQISHSRHVDDSRRPEAESSYGRQTEGQIEQISHSRHVDDSRRPEAESSYDRQTEGQIEQISHSRHVDISRPDVESSYGRQTEGQIEQISHNRHVDESRPDAESSYGRQTEGQIEQISQSRHVDESRPEAESSSGQHSAENGHVAYETKHEEVRKPTAEDIAAEEHHIIKEIEELAGLTSSPEGNTKNPITQQQEIIRELKGWADPSTKRNNGNEDIREINEEPAVETGSSHVNHETTIPPVRHQEVSENERAPEEPQEHRAEVVEAPAAKVISNQGSLGVHHGSMGTGHHVIHTESHKTSHQSGSLKTQSTPDPLDLMNIYNDYLNGDFKTGYVENPVLEPKKELKPEIKQAIDNIMREWEVLPDREGKPIPPPRNFKVTKHVKVTTTHNNPVVIHPSQTITKTVKTHTFHPSTSHHQTTHHINIAELLEQLRQLESSPHHRNVTWCEQKIKEFLTELNRKEASGIEINQTVQEETLHHILTQDHTITKEIHHVVGHDASGGVEEEPFVKKTVVELGLHEPTRLPLYNDTNSGRDEQTQGSEVGGQQENEPQAIDYGNRETSAEPPRELDETNIFTVTPSPHHIPPLESLSHQSHTPIEPKENTPEENPEITEHGESPESNGDMEPHELEPEGVTVAPAQPTPERPGQSDIEEFRGHSEKHSRPLPPNYQPQDKSEETNEIENHEPEKDDAEETKEHKRIDELSIDLPENEFSHEEGKEHKSIGNVNNDLSENEENAGPKDDVKTFIEKEQAAGEAAENSKGHLGTEEVTIEHQNLGHSGEQGIVNEEMEGGSFSHQGEEHVVHEVNTGGHSGTANNEYTVEETVHHSSEGGHEHSTGQNQTEYTEETVEHNSGGSHGHSGGANTEYVEETVEHHNSGGSHGHSGGANTEYVEETVEHHNSGGSHGHSGGANTEYVEETIQHHNSGGSQGHSGGGSRTEYTVETVEHHNTGGNHEINYDQLIEELISLESLPGHQAIDKCEEKIRHFLEVLKRQQERGFDENKAELERLRHLLEEMQEHKRQQSDNGINPQNQEASTSFWKKIGRKIKSTIEKAKTKAHDTVNGMMS